MIRKLAVIAISPILIAGLPDPATAETYVLSCVSNTNFATNFSVDTSAHRIVHLTSKDLESGDIFEVYEAETIVYWEDEIVSTFDTGRYRIYNYRTFNLDRAIYVNTGHYPDRSADELTAYNQFFTCERRDE